MEAAILEAASAAWASVSAIVVLLLGVVSLAGGRARTPGSVAFGGFAILWGLQILAGRWMAYAPEGSAERAHLAYAALLVPLPYLLVQFARVHSSRARGPAWRLASGASLAAALAAIGTLLFAPDLVYLGPTTFAGRLFPSWGPLFALLLILPFFGALGLTVVALDRARRASTTTRTALQHALLAAGLAMFTAFSAGNNLTFYAMDVLEQRRYELANAYVPLFLLLSVAMLAIGARAALEATRAPSAKTRRPALVVALATLVPLAWGALEGLLAYTALPLFNTVGLWRLVGVAMIAYALARTRMPELAPRSRHTTATALGIAGAATSGGLAAGLILLLAPAAPIVLLAALAIPLAALSPSVRIARSALRIEPGADLSDATLPRRIETYRAALEASVARESLDEDAGFLDALRERLAITPDVHDALLCIARDTVLPPPDSSHPGYERLRLLGEGAHGRAWLARRRADDELVVLKEPAERDASAREALVRQAKLTARVRHPRLVPVHGVVDSARGPFLVMEHMAGGSLADQLAHGPLPPRAAVAYTLDVLDALDALHGARATHGDVKPANVLLSLEGRAHLADLGLAHEDVPDATRTVANGAGTLAAMAPEQLDGAPASPATDVYATGALLYRLLTGEHYVDFRGLDEVRARERVRATPPRLPHPRVPAAVEPVLARALAKAPAQRYASARAMWRDLERAASSLEHQ